jgi:hypothetical protein
LAKQDKDKKKRRKLEKKAKDKKQQFENPFAGKPVQDDRLPDFEISGSFTSKGYNVKDVKFDFTEGKGDNISIAYGRGSRRANMTRSTLEKSRATLIGMAPQENKLGQEVQGFNFANVNYTNAVQNNKDLQEAKRFYGVGSVGVDKRTQFKNNQKKVQAILDARVTVASLPDALKGGAVEDAIKNKPYEQTEQQKINQANTNARLKQASRNKVKNALASIGTDPTIGYANEIQSKLGRAPIKVVVTRRRRGRWNTSLSADPKSIIEDYHSKTALINWAKEVNPEHAQIDPERTVSVVDVASSKQVPIYWTHNSRRRITGYRTVNTSTYKDVLATTRPEGEKMDLLYGKIIKKSQEKKKKFSTYYETNPKLEDYNYYGITDDEFGQMDNYKSALVTNIRSTDDARYALKNKIVGDFRIDATTTMDDNAPKQKYLQYQKTGQDSFITPTVTRLQSEISTIDKDVATQQHIIDAEKQKISKNLQLLDPTYMVDTLTADAEGKSKASPTLLRCRPYHLCAETNTSRRNQAKATRAEGKALFKTVEKIKKANIEAKIENLDEFKKHEWAGTQVSSIKESQQKIANVENKIATIREDAGGYRANENQNIENAVEFIEGKTRRFEVNGSKIARRDNFGRIKILDKEAYAKYIKNTPSEYLKQPDKLDTTVIPELEEENKEKTEKYNEIEKEYYRKERAKAQFGTTRPKGRVGVSRGGRRRRR